MEIKFFQSKNEKRLDLSKFFDGQEAWITLKKIPASIKQKITFSSFNTSMQKFVSMGKDKVKMKNNKITINPVDAIEMIKKTELNQKDIDEISETLSYINELYFEYGVDRILHNFTSEGKTINLDINFWDNTGNPELISFVLNEIKEFNGSYTLGE